MLTRRDALAFVLAAGAGSTLRLQPARGAALQQSGALIERAIPSTGERLPALGLGSSASFSEAAGERDVEGLKEVLKTMVAQGAKVFDTAPSYGASEQVAGRLAKELGIASKIFWATKVNVAYGSSAKPADARAQIEQSFAKLGVPKIDLIQVHNLGDVPTQLAILKELKQAGRVRYIGVTTTNSFQYAELMRIMRREPLDFIGVDYAIDNREVEKEILPLAIDRRIGVLGYVPFGRTSLFRLVGKRPVPDWAADFDATTWAQFFVKYILGNPAITSVTPATSSADHMLDDLQGARGRLPDVATRKKMVAFIEALPGGR